MGINQLISNIRQYLFKIWEHVFVSLCSWSFNINITIFKFKIANLNNKVNEIWIGIAFFSESTSQEPKKLRADYIENYKGIW